MKKKVLCIVMVCCIALTCCFTFAACNEQINVEFYNKTFVLNALTIDYDNQINDTTLGAALESNLSVIDWKETIRVNDSTIDYSTFNETVTTMTRLKEIFATFGKGMFGAKLTFGSKDAKTGTMSVGKDSDPFIVVDNADPQGVTATLKSTDGEEFARINLNYEDKTGEIISLEFAPTATRELKVCFTEEVQLFGTGRTDFVFVPHINFILQA